LPSAVITPELISDPDRRAEREALNGLRQYDAVLEMVEYFQHPERPFRFRPSQPTHLHRIALEGISSYAGNFRPAGIEIGGSRHEPAGAHQVPELVEDLCECTNANWASRTAIHLAAYVLWRLNWIHPFTDGNGRTSRVASYLVRQGQLDLTKTEEMISMMLARLLYAVHTDATGMASVEPESN
jgi:Fic family protein